MTKRRIAIGVDRLDHPLVALEETSRLRFAIPIRRQIRSLVTVAPWRAEFDRTRIPIGTNFAALIPAITTVREGANMFR